MRWSADGSFDRHRQTQELGAQADAGLARRAGVDLEAGLAANADEAHDRRGTVVADGQGAVALDGDDLRGRGAVGKDRHAAGRAHTLGQTYRKSPGAVGLAVMLLLRRGEVVARRYT